MNDKTIKHWLGFALRNKNMILQYLDNFRPEDLENGLLSIPESMINDQLSSLILGNTSPWLNRYHLNFSNKM